MFRKDKTSAAIIVVAFLTLVFFDFSNRREITTNPLSRIITVERLVEAGTFAHKTPTDSTQFPLSIDHVKVNGNIYSSKPPTYPLLMAGEARIIKMISGFSFYEHHRDYIHWLVLINQVLPYLLMLLTAFAMMKSLALDRWTTHFMLVALSFGILPFGYAVTINNHSLSAVLLFISFWITWRITRENKGNASHYFLVGLLSGFAVANDLPSGVFVLCLFVLLARKNQKLAFLALIGAAIPFIVSAGIYYNITGTWKPFYLQGGLYRYEGSYWQHPEGWDAHIDSFPVYLLNITFGHHGLFSISPLMLLPFLGIGLWLRLPSFPLRREFLLVFAFVLSVMVYVLFRTHNYGGYCIGLRWFISFMPLLLFTAYPLISKLGQRLPGKFFCILLLLLSLPWNFEAIFWDGFIQSGFEKFWMHNLGI